VRGRKNLPADPAGTYEIGCVMLSVPVFFEREDWILPPADWPRSGIMQGKSYDLSAGEGARVWDSCQAVARGRGLLAGRSERASEPAGPRYGEPVLVRPRLGQGTFRIAVTDAYGRSCAVTSEHSLPVLEAAHIRPFAQHGPHEVSNGVLLRTDIHRLFDKGYVTVTPDYRFLVSRRLKDEYQNGRTYYAMHGTPIHLPREPRDYPDSARLEWHARELFRDSA
jgi:putative restriction endonuclease